jgi:hypothetical protein
MPHKSDSIYVNCAKWDAKEKYSARYLTIIELYRKIFEMKAIPTDKQFWSLCGSQFRKKEEIFGELAHLLDEKLIQINQYFGVDREKKIIQKK